jgi:hypothetical protein
MATIVDTQAFLSVEERDGCLFLSAAECRRQGEALAEAYGAADPFPHAVIRDFLPAPVLRRALAEFPPYERGRFSDARSSLKTGYQLEKIESGYINALLNALNAAPFLTFLEAMTGIEGLIPDPWQMGGGLHETRTGGHLSIHADFNMHTKLRLKRRLNLILFLNEDWHPDYGGALELWSKDMQACRQRVQPEMGTAVIFNTDEDSFHGHPDPLTCPEDRTRRSIALYYYTADPALNSTQAARTTDFRARPGTADQVDHRTRMREWAKDWCPPAIYRLLNG